MKHITRIAVLALLASLLSGCFLTKLASTPMRLVGATASVAGAALSIIPVVGNEADAALEKVDGTIDTTADRIDDIPI
ncbi:MAG: hypothetical protein P1U78_11070 [Alcanivoracaceae bacterium]|nr:hypothetical protein [Alcanivoracaceae bacterium]